MDPQNQTQSEAIDPTVLALTKAIGQAETGGKYDAVGDGGNSQGAFQMSPGFLQEWAPKAGVQYAPGKQLSLEEQNRIAYNAVKTMGTTGDPAHPEYGKLSPSQIASKWNTGDPNMYAEDPSYGRNNAYGSIGGYVDKIKENYEKNLGITSQPSPTKISQGGQSPFITALEGAGIGGGAWLLGTLKKFARPAIVDVSAGIGATAGTAVAPGAGTAVGAAGGAMVGSQIADAILGDSNTPPPPSGGNVAPATPEPQGPDFTATGNQVEPNKLHSDESMQASQELHNAITEMMQNTQSGRNFSNSQPGQQAIATASAFGLVHPDENGALIFDEEKRQGLLGKVGNLQDKIIEANDGGASPLSVRNYAGSYIGQDRYATALERQDAARIASKELKARRIPINGEMSLVEMRQAQKEHYSAAKNGYKGGRTTAEILAHKALGNAYGRVIRDNLPDKELYDRTKKMEAALINTKEVGKRVQGKNPPKNQGLIKNLMHSGARWAAVYVGDKIGGPIGAILGDMVGIHLSRAVDKKYGKTTFETPTMRKALAILEEGEPQVYQTLVEELKKHGVTVPEESEQTKEELDTVAEVKHEIADLKNPKTGEFKYSTNAQFHNPKQKQGLLSHKLKGKGQVGLIQLRKSPPMHQ